MATTADLTRVTFSPKGIMLLLAGVLVLIVVFAIVTPIGQAIGGTIVGTADRLRSGFTRETQEASASNDSPFPGAS